MSLVFDPAEELILDIDGETEILAISERGEPGPPGDEGPAGGASQEALDALAADLADETDARVAGDATNADTIDGLATAVTILTDALDTEFTRATTAEDALAADRDALTADLEAEIDRATGAEADEAERATAAEIALGARIDTEAAARAATDALKQATAEKNQPNGYAGLDGNGVVPAARIDGAIARDAEVDTKIAAEATQRDAAIATAIAALQAALVGGAPGTLDALNELAAAIGDDPNFAATIAGQIAGKQAAHANLTALAGLVLAANKLPYATGPGAMALADLTAFGRTLAGLADLAALKELLDLTGVYIDDAGILQAPFAIQAPGALLVNGAFGLLQHPELGPMNAFDVNDYLRYDTAANVFEFAVDGVTVGTLGVGTTLALLSGLATTAIGRSLLTAADAPALRAILGLGTMATEAAATYATQAALNTAIADRQAADAAYDAINTYAANTTLSAADLRCLVRVNGAFTLSIPTDLVWAAPVGTRIDFQQIGAAQMTIAAVTPGTTAVTSVGAAPASPKARQQYSGGSIVKVAANNWTVLGDVV